MSKFGTQTTKIAKMKTTTTAMLYFKDTAIMNRTILKGNLLYATTLSLYNSVHETKNMQKTEPKLYSAQDGDLGRP
jgi:hypothetical protein